MRTPLIVLSACFTISALVFSATATAEKQAKKRKINVGAKAPKGAETGCIKYDLHQNSDDPGAFMFYEIWKSKEALDEHIATPHLQNFIEKGGDILAEPLDVTLWKKITD